MKKLINFILSFALVFHGYTPFAFGALTEVDRQEVSFLNLIAPLNGGFESGKAKWTASGGTFTASTTNPGQGNGMAVWNASSAGQTFSSTAVTIPNGFYAQNGEFSCDIRTPSGTATHLIEVYDGTNIIGTASVTSSTYFFKATATFVFPTSGTITGRLKSVASDEPSVDVDNCYLGKNRNVGVVNTVSDPVEYTPTISGGATYDSTNSKVTWQRIGPKVKVVGDIQFTAISSSGTQLGISMPSSITMDTTKHKPYYSTTYFTVGTAWVAEAGGSETFHDGQAVLITSANKIQFNGDDGGNVNWVIDDNAGSPFAAWTTNSRLHFEVEYFVSGWSSGAAVLPNAQLTPTTATYTAGTNQAVTVPAGATWARVKMVGGGGSGAGGGTSATSGSSGNQSCFGTNSTACTSPLLQAAAGSAGGIGANNGGAGGACTINSPATGSAFTGQQGSTGLYDAISPQQLTGGVGGSAPFWAGGGGSSNGSGGYNGQYGGGGGGGSVQSTVAYSGSGGGGGGGCDAIVKVADSGSTFYVTVGAAQTSVGAAGTGGGAGGQGGAGFAEITWYYQQSPTPILVSSVVAADNTTGVTRINTVASVSASTTLAAEYETYSVSASGGARTITLPDAVSFKGKKFIIIKNESSANAVTMASTSSQTIGGIAAGSFIMGAQNDRLEVQSDGANWQIVAYAIATGARSGLTTAQTGVSSKVIPYNNDTWDPQSAFSSGTFTTKIPGKYAVKANASPGSLDGATDVNLLVRKNGTGVRQDYCWRGAAGTSTWAGCSISDTVQLVVGDTLDIYINGDASFDIDSTATRTSFAIEWISF
jgi:hypothetical protein